ncbi:hypothetical protein TNCV_3978131 [Trichonephila clavipes]|nr:hypothetical protein TNCV_3978131 [Trichonephila clavipes]
MPPARRSQIVARKIHRSYGQEFLRQSLALALSTMQWNPAHVDIEGNDMADSLANEALTLEPITSSTTIFDANTVAKQKLCSNPRKIIGTRIKL